jgi:twitching motility protein PilI
VEQHIAAGEGPVINGAHHVGIMVTPSQALTEGFTHAAALPAATQANALRKSATADAGAQVRQGLRIGALGLMVRYEDGSELTEMPALYRLPNTPDWFRGIANLHGMLIPVFDLSRYLQIVADPTAKPMLLVLSHGVSAAGVVVDGLPQRLRWTDANRADTGAAPASLAPHVRAAALIEGQLWFDLESAGLLDALEQAMESLQ